MEHKKHFTKWTRKEFEALPRADYDNHEVGVITDFIILPKRTMHDSGYRNMEFVVLKRGVPTYIIGGGSDVVLLGGIGGVVKGFDSPLTTNKILLNIWYSNTYCVYLHKEIIKL